MSATPDNTLADPEQLIADLRSRLAGHEAELTQALGQLAIVTFNSGTFNDTCQITAMMPPSALPHIEPLEYKTPSGGRCADGLAGRGLLLEPGRG
jgi:hypothetical protein